jgi:voltage-gated sodium channel
MQLHNLLKNFIESRFINIFITLVILINAITLGLETSKELVSKIGNILIYVDKIALSIFVIELLIKLFVYRLSFFKSGWNVFDFIIVTIALIPTSGPLSILRAFRIFRALRLLSMVPSMKKVIQAMFYAIPGIASVGTIIVLIFYISAVLVTNFFGNKFEDWFGSIGESMYSLFQIMTLESWSMGIVRPVMEEYPYAWAFFVPFILVTTFAVLNLFIGIIVDAMQHQTNEDENKSNQNSKLNLEKKILSIENEIKEIKEILKKK